MARPGSAPSLEPPMRDRERGVRGSEDASHCQALGARFDTNTIGSLASLGQVHHGHHDHDAVGAGRSDLNRMNMPINSATSPTNPGSGYKSRSRGGKRSGTGADAGYGLPSDVIPSRNSSGPNPFKVPMSVGISFLRAASSNPSIYNDIKVTRRSGIYAGKDKGKSGQRSGKSHSKRSGVSTSMNF